MFKDVFIFSTRGKIGENIIRMKRDKLIINPTSKCFINNIRLIIIGQKANETIEINEIIKRLKLTSKVKIFSNLTDYEVGCFYKLTSLFVFPSIYEGFGIPILEAMASSKPMALSNLEVFREITENKYIYFDPYDPLSIANNISSEVDKISTYIKKFYENINNN